MGKKMTAREKKIRAQVRERLREEGFLPPKKAPLNRKKFAAEVKAEWDAFANKPILCDLMGIYAIWAVLAGTERTVSLEQVGVLKVLKITMEIEKSLECAKETGKEITFGQMIEEIINPILTL